MTQFAIFLICSLLFISSQILVCQDKLSVDSGPVSADTVQINAMNRKALSLYRANPDSAFLLSRLALNQSEIINYKEGIADAYNALAYAHLLNFTRNDSANHYYRLAFDIYKELNNFKGMGSVSYGLGYLYSFKGNLTESERQLRNGLKYFKKVDNERGVFNSYHALSYIYKQLKNYEKAEEYINNAIAIARQINNLSTQADIYNTKGNLYKDQALFEQAIDIYFEALKLWEEADDSAGMAIAHGSIGNMYYYQQNYKKALEYMFSKLPISLNKNDYWETSKTYNSIALVYNALEKNDSALIYFKKGLQLNLMMNYPSGIADSYHALSNTFFLLSNTDSALYYANKSIIISRNIFDRAKLASYHILRGKIYFNSDQKELALQDVKEGYSFAKELEMPFEISDASELLSKIYSRNRNYQKAYNMLLEHKLMQDSLNKAENIRKITQLELQYAFDKKQRKYEHAAEQEKQAQKAKMMQQRIFIIGLSLLILFLVLLGTLIIRQKNLHVKFKTIELGQRLLRTQMNPHFIFNSLTAIQDYLLSNNAKDAGNFLARFAALMHQILENSRTEYVTVENEINTLNNYLEIQKLRFENKFTYTIDVDSSIDIETYAIPPMLAQPFIENAIEHGLMLKKEAGKISIHLHLQNELVHFEVEDNGIGRDQSLNLKTKESRSSLATALTQERLNYLKKLTGKDNSFFIEDLFDNNNPVGTRVSFSISYQRIYN